jgi:flavorubredoxin
MQACDRVLKMEVETIVPGHGPIGTKEDLKFVRDYLLLIQEEGGKELDAGHGPWKPGRE